MPKLRVFILMTTFLVVGLIGTAAILYARGYRLGLKQDQITLGPTGLLVANSEPKAAQVFVNDELKTATDNTLSLPPGEYNVTIKKEGYQPWQKHITINKEVVTQIDAFLIASAPSLTALSLSGATNPTINDDNSKMVYVVPKSEDNQDKAGLWLIESNNLPIGFNREPRQITDGDLTGATFEFSPDSRQLMMTNDKGNYLLDLGTFTPQALRVNVGSKYKTTIEEWNSEKTKRLAAQVNYLPDKIESVFLNNASNIRFSADDNRILYTASGSANLAEGLVDELPGSSTQEQKRDIQDGETYVYDIREDKNFKVADKGQIVYWLPNSLNLVKPLEGKINVLDYDGTNEKTIFSGTYNYPHAYPSINSNKLLVLTSFGSADSHTNLYWLSLQ